MKRKTVLKIRKSLVSRWGLTAAQAKAIDKQDPEWIKAMAISVKLGALLNEDAHSERHWFTAPRSRFRGWSAKEIIENRSAGLQLVAQMVEDETP